MPDPSDLRVIRKAFLQDGNRESRGESPQDLDASVYRRATQI